MEDKSLFSEEIFSESHCILALENIKSQKATTILPDNFKIKSNVDIEALREYLASTYCGHPILYRGHESTEYRIESTIVRLLKDKQYSTQEITDAELKGYYLFCQDIFRVSWLNYKVGEVDNCLFKLSLGRHLGLPCRLIDVTARLETAIWFAVMNPKFYDKDGELIVFILDRQINDKNKSPFNSKKVSYANVPYLADSLNDLPLGEQRRFVQNGHFVWVNDASLLDEQGAIVNASYAVKRFVIPSNAKIHLAASLYCDVYSGGAWQLEIEKIKHFLLK